MEKLKRSLTGFLVPVLSILLAFVIGAIIMACLGANPFAAMAALFQGAFGTVASVGTTLNRASPLIFTALCACFAYKCGVFNLGGEGQFLIGATAAFCAVHLSGAKGIGGILLALLVGQPDVAFSRKQLLDIVWGGELSGDTRTLDTHIKQIRHAISPYSERIITLRGVGYRFE